MLKLVREIGSGEAGDEVKGDKIVSVVVAIPATPLEALGKKEETRQPLKLGIPLVTKKENVPGGTLLKV